MLSPLLSTKPGPVPVFPLLLVAIMALAAGPLTAGPQDTAPASRPATAVMASMELTNDETSAVLTLRLSQPSRWLAGGRANGPITLTLEDVTPAAAISNLLDSEGLVASVEVFSELVDSTPTTRLEVRLRSKCTYAVAAVESVLVVRFWSSDAAPPERLGSSVLPPAAPSRPAPPPASTNTAAGTAPPAAAIKYRIGAGDVIQVDVFGLPELTRETRVLLDGSITLPLLGEIQVAGLDLRQAERTIASLLTQRQLVNDPQVSILVKEYESRGISIQGAVSKPGVYQMVESKSLLEMIGRAGGLQSSVRPGTSIIVLRESEGTQERIAIDAMRLVEQGDLALNLLLQPGDVVMVPPPRILRAFVSGAVQKTGAVEFSSTDPFTVFQAVTAAGGPTERANLRKVTVIRRRPDGSEERIRLNLKKVRKGSQEDILLEDGDTIVIGEWFF
jgi:polysaccharide export outer membrane protein